MAVRGEGVHEAAPRAEFRCIHAVAVGQRRKGGDLVARHQKVAVARTEGVMELLLFEQLRQELRRAPLAGAKLCEELGLVRRSEVGCQVHGGFSSDGSVVLVNKVRNDLQHVLRPEGRSAVVDACQLDVIRLGAVLRQAFVERPAMRGADLRVAFTMEQENRRNGARSGARIGLCAGFREFFRMFLQAGHAQQIRGRAESRGHVCRNAFFCAEEQVARRGFRNHTANREIQQFRHIRNSRRLTQRRQQRDMSAGGIAP